MSNNLFERLFKLQEHGTTIKTEIIGGLTTFAAMSYILVVNPGILGLSGMPVEGLITVTALAACIGTLLMAAMTNYPIALAPGMGLNAFFAFTICMSREIPWEAALGIVFWNGILFLMLSLTGVRTKIAEAIPPTLKIGVQCGIGLFIAFIGLKNAGLIVDNPATFVQLGDLSDPAVMLALVGIIFTVVMIVKKVTRRHFTFHYSTHCYWCIYSHREWHLNRYTRRDYWVARTSFGYFFSDGFLVRY